MKLFYLAPVVIDDEKLDGVAKKVLNHIDVFSSVFDVYLFSYGKEGLVIRHGGNKKYIQINGRHRRYALYEEVEKAAKEEKVDCAYIRYPKSERRFIQLIKELHKLGIKIVTEIPTYPYGGNITESLRVFSIAVVDGVFRKQLKKYIQRIITFSDDAEIFGIPTIRTINGIVFDKVEMVTRLQPRSSINLISVATNYACHGFDRIIRGLEDYYSSGGQKEIRFRIVGDGPAIADYRKVISECPNLCGRVELNGFQTGEELKRLYNDSDIAINSLALYRLNLTRESTLKTKEYLAKGLPIISSTSVDGLDEDDNEKYVKLFPDCGERIDIKEIIDFYHRVYDGKESESIAKEIRKAGRKKCDMSVTMAPVIDYLMERTK